MAAVEFLQLKIVPYCVLRKSFRIEAIAAALAFDQGDLIKQSEVKGLGGKDAPKRVFDRMVEFFKPGENPKAEFDL